MSFYFVSSVFCRADILNFNNAHLNFLMDHVFSMYLDAIHQTKGKARFLFFSRNFIPWYFKLMSMIHFKLMFGNVCLVMKLIF